MEIVLDLGRQPSVRHWPEPSDPTPDPAYPLALSLCHGCGLVQLDRDDTSGPELPVPEPEAVTAQARQAVADLARLGHLAGRRTVHEFPSPHGGSWLPHLPLEATNSPADLVVDNFGLMHEDDLRAALDRRAEALAEDGLAAFLIQPLGDIVRTRQWTTVRHGHPGYFSLSWLSSALASVGLGAFSVLRYPLYGGVAVLLARAGGTPDAGLRAAREAEAGLDTPAGVVPLVDAVERTTTGLRRFLESRRSSGTMLYAYPAASKAVAELAMMGESADVIRAVGDAARSKQGRCLPGSRILVISPADLVAADPDEVLLMLPDLAEELQADLPRLAGRLIGLDNAVAEGMRS